MKRRLTICVTLAGWLLAAAQTNVPDSVQRILGNEPYLVAQHDLGATDTAAIFLTDVQHAATNTPSAVWLPDPQKSLWYAFIFPGAGQIYNRSYWKLPIVYGGAVGLAYGISWNNRYYQEYSQAYRDIMDSDPNTKSYENLLPYGTDPSSSYAQKLMKTKHNTYRRYRDLCIVGAVAFYALTIIDAYVDAQLADFDINPDLSMHVRPTIFVDELAQRPNIGVDVGFRF